MERLEVVQMASGGLNRNSVNSRNLTEFPRTGFWQVGGGMDHIGRFVSASDIHAPISKRIPVTVSNSKTSKSYFEIRET